MSTKLNKSQSDKLRLQIEEEYNFALKYRQKRHAAWNLVDELYYGKKRKSLVTRANVHIPKMQGTIETLISKIDSSPFMEYDPMEEGDKKAAKYNNAFLAKDRSDGDWDLKDTLAKKEAALYGRTIFKKYSTSEDNFTDYLEVIDVLDFLIDPGAGGVTPMKNARHCGHDNIVKTKWDLGDSVYDQKAVKRLAKKIQSDGDVDTSDSAKQARRTALGLSDATYISADAIALVEWYTEFEGKRYYILVDKDFTEMVRVELLKDVTSLNEFPFATWAPFARINEFWTPGYGELVSEPNQIQNIVMSQILDNNTFRNYGMKAYDVDKIVNPNQLTPRPMGKIAVTGNPKDSIMDIQFPHLQNALETYKLVDLSWDKEIGVTNAAKGVPNSKRMSATEFDGLLNQTSDRFFSANRTYSSALKRIAKLYYHGVQDNMTKKRAVRLLGATGYEWKKLKASELAMSEFDVTIISGLEQEQQKNVARDRFGEFVGRYVGNMEVNQEFLRERDAINMGLTPAEVTRFMSPEMEGDWEILSEAASENEIMLTKDHKPNKGATAGHIQRHLDFLRMTEGLDDKIVDRITAHAQAEMPYVVPNESRKELDVQVPQSQLAQPLV